MDFMVVIECPTTRQDVPTGIVVDISTFATMPSGDTELICPACKQTHVWSMRDATLTSIPRSSANAQIANR